MAADPQTLTTFAAALREKWLGGMQKAFNTDVLLFSRLKRRKRKISGEYYLYPVHAGRNWGVGARAGEQSATAGYLPEAGHQRFEQALLRRAHVYGKFMLTGAAIDAGADDGAVIDLTQAEMEGLENDMAMNANRQMHGDGTGAMAAVPAPADSANQTVDSVQYLSEGMPITFAEAADGSKAIAAVIQSINRTTKVITLTASKSLATASYTACRVYGEGLCNTNYAATFGNEASGLKLIVSDSGTYANINRATAGNGYWKALVFDGSGGLSLDFMTEVRQEMRNAAGGQPTVLLASPKQWRAYANLLHPDRVWVDKTKRLDGGYQYLDFNGVPIIEDPYCPEDRIYFLDEDTLELLVEADLDFVRHDGQVLRWIGTGSNGVDAYEGAMLFRFNLGCNNPKRNAVIYNLP